MQREVAKIGQYWLRAPAVILRRAMQDASAFNLANDSTALPVSRQGLHATGPGRGQGCGLYSLERQQYRGPGSPMPHWHAGPIHALLQLLWHQQLQQQLCICCVHKIDCAAETRVPWVLMQPTQRAAQQHCPQGHYSSQQRYCLASAEGSLPHQGEWQCRQCRPKNILHVRQMRIKADACFARSMCGCACAAMMCNVQPLCHMSMTCVHLAECIHAEFDLRSRTVERRGGRAAQALSNVISALTIIQCNQLEVEFWSQTHHKVIAAQHVNFAGKL